MTADHRVQAWFHSLRDAIAERNERLYRERVVQFLITAEGVSFVQRNLDTAAARGVMAVAYERLAPLLGLRSPEDLFPRMLALSDVLGSDEPTDDSMASTFTHYLRIGRDWSRICQIEISHGAALALLLFEPLLVLYDANRGDAPGLPSAPALPEERSASPIHRGVQFA